MAGKEEYKLKVKILDPRDFCDLRTCYKSAKQTQS